MFKAASFYAPERQPLPGADAPPAEILLTAASRNAPPRRRSEVLLFASNGSPLRILSVVAAAFAVGGVVLAAMLLRHPLHLAHLISWNERMVWASGLFLTFTSFFCAVWMYERRMAERLVLLQNGNELRLTTPTLFGAQDHTFAVDDVLETQYHEGDRSGEEASSPPWLYVKVRGRPSFVVSLNGTIPNREQLLQVLSSHP